MSRGLATLLLAALGASPAEAQPCVRTGCHPSERDERGCCPAPPEGGQQGGQGGGGGHHVVRCLPGQVQSADTDNRCCWPGQVWSREQRSCVGPPECPADRGARGSDCVCPDGMTDRGDARGHCCWPGQVFSESQGVCIGAPRCPRRFAADAGTCVAPPAGCAPGMEQSERTAFQCCWPGQAWDPASGRCAGNIACANGWARVGDHCIAPAGGCAPGHVADASTSNQCCWPGQRWDATNGSCAGAPTCAPGWTRSAMSCVPHAAQCPAGRVSDASTSGQCCWPGQRWDADRSQCAGTPTCLEGWARSAGGCVAPPAGACPAGQERNAATSNQCCWPGQRWNGDAGQCAGAPSCASGWARAGTRCLPPPSGECEAGHERSAATSNQCCWPGQRWDADAGQCAGTPSCTRGWARAGARCVPPSSACDPGHAASAQTQGQCCWPGQSWNADAGACAGAPACTDGWARSGMSCVPPPAGVCEGGRVAGPQTQGQCCWRGQSWDVEQGRCAGQPQCAGSEWTDGTDCRALSVCSGGQVSSQRTLGQCCWPGQWVGEGNRPLAGVQRALIVGEAREGNTQRGTDTVTPSCASSGAASDETWYFTPSTTAEYAITLDSSYDGVLAVFRDGELGCNDDDPDTSHSRVTLTLEAQVTYRIVVDGYSGGSGSYVIRISGPPGGERIVPEATGGAGGTCAGMPTACPGETAPSGQTCSVEAWRAEHDRVQELARQQRELVILIRDNVIGFGTSSFVGDRLLGWRDWFLLGGALDVMGVFALARDGGGASLFGFYFDGHADAAVAIGDQAAWGFDFRGDLGLELGPLVLGAALRLDLITSGSYFTSEGVFGPFLALGLPGTHGELGVWLSVHWLPDLYDNDSLVNFDANLDLAISTLIGLSVRVRYDEKLGNFRELVVFQLGLTLVFDPGES